jgi:hypothetical protein
MIPSKKSGEKRPTNRRTRIEPKSYENAKKSNSGIEKERELNLPEKRIWYKIEKKTSL